MQTKKTCYFRVQVINICVKGFNQSVVILIPFKMDTKLKCPAVNCKVTFSRQYNLNRHFERFHNQNDIVEKCLLCGQVFETLELLNKHYRSFHRPTKKFYQKESAFRKNVVTYRFNYGENELNFSFAQKKIIQDLMSTITYEAALKTIVKVSLVYICEMSMIDHAGEKITTTLIPFRAPAFLAHANNNSTIGRNIRQGFLSQNDSMEEFCNSGSNWTFDRAVAFDIEITALRPVLVGDSDDSTDNSSSDSSAINERQSFDGYYCLENIDKVNITTIKNKKFLFNPNNRDKKCFLYCLHNFFVKEKGLKKTFKQFESTLNLKNITFPISIPHVKKFMKQNPNLNIKLNILLRHTNGHVYPYEYGIGDGISYVNLLLIYRKDGESHFLQILNVNKFLRKIYENCGYETKFFCENCLNYFSKEVLLEAHKKICCLNKPRMELTPDEPIMKFNNVKNQHPVEYIAFLDFECILPNKKEVCLECSHLRCKCDRSFTHITTSQLPITYSLLILDMNSKIIHEKTYSGNNAADNLIEHLLQEEQDWIKDLFNTFKEMKLNSYEQNNYENSMECYLCQKEFFSNVAKCRDHCHFTGKYLGAACNTCNLNRRKSRKLKIFMHNGSKFDFHFIIKALNEKKGVTNLHVLPYNSENFRTISFNSFIFCDSMSFLQASLAKLSDDLSKTNNSYLILKQTDLVKTNNRFDRVKFNMLLGKAYFPYEYWLVLLKFFNFLV